MYLELHIKTVKKKNVDNDAPDLEAHKTWILYAVYPIHWHCYRTAEGYEENVSITSILNQTIITSNGCIPTLDSLFFCIIREKSTSCYIIFGIVQVVNDNLDNAQSRLERFVAICGLLN